MARAPLPVQPVTAVAVAAAAAAAAAVTPSLVGGGWGAALAAAAAAAALTSLAWPRFATDTLRLHGTVFPSPATPGDWPLVGRVAGLAAAVAARRVCYLFADWRAAAGAPNWQVWMAGSRTVFITHPADVRHVLARVNPPRDTAALASLGLLLSPRMALLTAGDIHTRWRRLVVPPLNADRVLAVAVAAVVADVAGGGGRLAAALGTAADVADRGAAAGTAGAADAAAGGSFCPGQLLEWLTLSVIHEVLVSQPLPSDEILDKLNSLLPLFIPVEMVPSPKKLFAPRAVGRLQAAGAYFKALYVRHEAARLAAYEDGSWKAVPPKDILDVLLADVDQPKGAYRGDRLRLAADYMLLFMAGYDTTAHSLEWGILTLCRHPEVQDRIVDEVADVLGCSRSTPAAELPLTPASLDRLTYLQAVWKEVLRLYPITAAGPNRRTQVPVTLPSDGSVIPAGTAIKLSQFVVLHDEAVFPDAHAFVPERWLPDGPGGAAGVKVASGSYFPFGLGPIACPGRRLSQLEWKTTIVCILWGYQVRLATKEPVRGVDLGTFRPAPYEVRVTRRAGAPPPPACA